MSFLLFILLYKQEKDTLRSFALFRLMGATCLETSGSFVGEHVGSIARDLTVDSPAK